MKKMIDDKRDIKMIVFENESAICSSESHSIVPYLENSERNIQEARDLIAKLAQEQWWRWVEKSRDLEYGWGMDIMDGNPYEIAQQALDLIDGKVNNES